MMIDWKAYFQNELGKRELLLAWTRKHTPELDKIILHLEEEVKLYKEIVQHQGEVNNVRA